MSCRAGAGDAGRRLTDVIVDHARQIGIREIFGEVFFVDAAVLTLARNLGFRPRPEGDAVIRASLVLE